MRKLLTAGLKLALSIHLLSQTTLGTESNNPFPRVSFPTALFNFSLMQINEGRNTEVRREEQNNNKAQDEKFPWEDFPPEMKTAFCPYMDDNTLLRMRATDTQFMQIADGQFHKRASIKPPLACLTQNGHEHSAPHTMSYFLRKRLWQTPPFLDLTFPNWCLSATFAKCAKFCQEWNYPAESLMTFISDIARNPLSAETKSLQCMSFFLLFNLQLNEMVGTDPLELRVFINSMEPSLLNLIFDQFSSTVDLLIKSNGKEVALGYMKRIGNACADIGDFESAQKIFEKITELDNASGSFYLGLMRSDRENNIEDAIKYYTLAADQGHKDAKYNLGNIHFNRAVEAHEKDLKEAEVHLKKALSLDYPTAARNLGVLYEEDLNNLDEAKKYYEIEILKNNCSFSQYKLGFIFKNEGDLENAKKYFTLGAHNGDDDSQYELGLILSKENNIDQAKKYYKMAANQGHLDAQWNLGVMFYAENNIAQAKTYWTLAAEQGHVMAQWNMGFILKNEGNIFKAKYFLAKAAQNGSSDAQTHLGVILYHEGAVQQAISLFRRAAEQGDASAIRNLRSLGLL